MIRDRLRQVIGLVGVDREAKIAELEQTVDWLDSKWRAERKRTATAHDRIRELWEELRLEREMRDKWVAKSGEHLEAAQEGRASARRWQADWRHIVAWFERLDVPDRLCELSRAHDDEPLPKLVAGLAWVAEQLESARADAKTNRVLAERNEANCAELRRQLAAKHKGDSKLRLHWLADIDAMDRALDALGVPAAPETLRDADRYANDEDPRPSLAWRVAWLQGRVAAARLNSQPDPEDPSHDSH